MTCILSVHERDEFGGILRAGRIDVLRHLSPRVRSLEIASFDAYALAALVASPSNPYTINNCAAA
jgi:hypothetical protein